MSGLSQLWVGLPSLPPLTPKAPVDGMTGNFKYFGQAVGCLKNGNVFAGDFHICLYNIACAHAQAL